MEKVLIAKTLANKLFAAEEAVDEALVKASALLTGMIETKTQLNLAVTVGDQALAEVSKAISMLSATRSALVLAHHTLDESKLRLGIRTKMSPINKDGKPFALAEAGPELREAV